MSVQCIEVSHRGARATGVCTGICTWAVTHMGVGERCWYRGCDKVGGVRG